MTLTKNYYVRYKKLQLFLLTLLIMIIICSPSQNLSQSDNNKENQIEIIDEFTKNPSFSTEYAVSSILIDALATGVGAHNWSWAVSQDWCSGEGSYGNPYIIHSVGINANGKGYGISITDSDVYVIIQYCEIINGGYYDEAILFDNVSNCVIQHNLLTEDTQSIEAVNYCDNNTIFNNTFTGSPTATNELGIYFINYCDNNSIYDNIFEYMNLAIQISGNSQRNRIENNTISILSDEGIYISGNSHWNNVSGNIITDGSSDGIYIYSSHYCRIYNNTVSSIDLNGINLISNADHNNISTNTLTNNGLFGIKLDSSSNNSLDNNIFTNNPLGIYASTPTLSYYQHHIETNNLVDGNSIYYFRDTENITNTNITDPAQIYLVNCTDCELSGYELSENDYGIALIKCDNISLVDNLFSNNIYDGIYAYQLTNANLTSNNCSFNLRNGISFDRDCLSNLIYSNNITMNGDNYGTDYGIWVNLNCDDNLIVENAIIGTINYGIAILSTSNNNSIIGNQIHQNIDQSIFISSHCDGITITNNNISLSNYGIYLSQYCDYLEVYRNDIENINYYGIYITYYCTFSNITFNNISNAGISGNYAGIRIQTYSDNARICNNRLINNQQYGLYFQSTSNAIVQNNSFIGTGFGIYNTDNSYLAHHFNRNNTLDGKIIYYYLNEYNLDSDDFSNAGQIYMINCIGATITQPNIQNTQYGLFFSNTSEILVFQANFSYNIDNAIRLYNSSLCEFKDSYVSYSENSGLIYLHTNCYRNTFQNNTIYHPVSIYQESILLSTNCMDNRFIDNHILDAGEYAIYLTTNCDLNNFTGNILNITRRYDGIYINNDCDSNYFGYNDITRVNRYALYMATNCDNNVFFTNNLTKGTGSYAIYIYNNCQNTSIIQNNITYNNHHGIYLYQNCHYSTISKNNISNNGGSGSNGHAIYVNNLCDYLNITQNYISQNRLSGIYIIDECDDGIIEGNIITQNLENGIKTEDQCKSFTIYGNNISKNGIHGLYILINCDDYLIEKNYFQNNSDHGIFLNDRCDANAIFNNTLSFNFMIGIGLYSTCSDNDIHLNYLYNNTLHAYDDNSATSWDNATKGNYWDNYTDRDLDDDGIGDDPWGIPGNGNNFDHYPIWNDGKDLDPQPDISSPPDIEYFFREEGNGISWIANCTSEDSYIIRRNGTIIIEGVWFNWVPITINVDELAVGIHLYECTVNSTYSSNNEESDIVIVTVKRTAPLISHPNNIELNVGDYEQIISWMGDAPFPQNYSISLESDLLEIGSWTNHSPIEFEVPDLMPGTYYFECVLNVSSGETIADTVMVVINEPELDISHPDDISYQVTDTVHYILWNASSTIPDTVIVFQDGVEIFSEVWISGNSINISVDGLAPGSYTFQCIYNTTSGKFAADSVLVRVTEPLPSINHPGDIVYFYGDPSDPIIWIGHSLIPDKVTIYLDEEIIMLDNWISDHNISIASSSLSLGTHSFECILNSTSGLFISDTVLVTVLETPPQITINPDIEINETTQNATLSWTGYSEFAQNVTVYRNGEIIYEDDWVSGEEITIPVGNLTAGTYVFECVMVTSTGEIITDAVIVQISDDIDITQQLKDEQEKNNRLKRILWIVIIILGIILGASIGMNSYFIKKQRDYMTHMDLIRQIKKDDYEIAKNKKIRSIEEYLVTDDYLTNSDQQPTQVVPVEGRKRLFSKKKKEKQFKMEKHTSKEELESGTNSNEENILEPTEKEKILRDKTKIVRHHLEEKDKIENKTDEPENVDLKVKTLDDRTKSIILRKKKSNEGTSKTSQKPE